MSLRTDELQICQFCKALVQVTVVLCDVGPHFAKAVCPECQRTLGFIPKPKNQDRLDKRPNGCPTPEQLGISRCQVCLKDKDRTHRQYLSTHHIDDDPTNNDRLNLLVVCYACHRLIHWLRTYFND